MTGDRTWEADDLAGTSSVLEFEVTVSFYDVRGISFIPWRLEIELTGLNAHYVNALRGQRFLLAAVDALFK